MTPRRRTVWRQAQSKHIWPENIFQNVAITTIKELSTGSKASSPTRSLVLRKIIMIFYQGFYLMRIVNILQLSIVIELRKSWSSLPLQYHP